MDASRLLLVCGLCAVLLGSFPTLAEQASGPTKDLFYFVIDRSGSIGEKKLVDDFSEAVVGYVDDLYEDTAQVDIVFFNNAATVPRSWYPMDSRAKKEFKSYFDANFRPEGQTLLYDTIAGVLSRVRASEAGFRAITIIILSDGDDNQSKSFKSWADLEKILPDGWAQKRKGFSVVWATVGFEPQPKNNPGPESFVKRHHVPDPREIAKAFIPPPKAAFTAHPQKVKVNEPVLFALDDDTGATAAKWSFGDGMTSDKKTDTHVFDTEGTYNIKVEVKGFNETTILMPASKVVLSRNIKSLKLCKLPWVHRKILSRTSPDGLCGNSLYQKRKTKPKYGHIGPCVHDLAHSRAGSGTQDIPACHFQQD